ncbi:MAG: type II toxin-antitoxin system death-on-curing family toxin [Aquificae bacterium]|nr:type II toxin-antitoxin system death-on-curing family toxin [Aquificota bacterium]
MRYLSVNDVLALYVSIFKKLGGRIGLRDISLLESAVDKPKASFSGLDLYEGVLVKAIVLCEAIIKNHPFVDGNKRVGVLALLEFLEIDGYDTSKIPDDVLYDIAMGFASGELKREEAVKMIEPFLLSESYTAYLNELTASNPPVAFFSP